MIIRGPTRPHPSFPSPKRCCIFLMTFITTTSTSVLYSPLSESIYFISFSVKRGLCVVPLLRSNRAKRRLGTQFEVRPSIYHSRNVLCCQTLRKARAVCWWLPLLGEVGRGSCFPPRRRDLEGS